MAFVAQSDQVLFRVVAGVAAKFLVMDFKVSHRSTELASPAVPPQHTFSYLLVFAFFEPDRRSFQQILHHWVFWLTSSANACFCSPERKPNNREIVCSNRSGC